MYEMQHQSDSNGIINTTHGVEKSSSLENVYKENGYNDNKENNLIYKETVTTFGVGMEHTVPQDRIIPTEKPRENQEATESSEDQAGVPHEDESTSIEDIYQENLSTVTQERSKCTWDSIIVKLRLILKYESLQ